MEITSVYQKLRHVQWINWMILYFSCKTVVSWLEKDTTARKIGYDPVREFMSTEHYHNLFFYVAKYKLVVRNLKILKRELNGVDVTSPFYIMGYRVFKGKSFVSYDDKQYFAFACETAGFDCKIDEENDVLAFELTSAI